MDTIYEKTILHGFVYLCNKTKVRQLKLEPGDLQIFKGRFTMHRVTKVKGNKPRYLCIPAFVLDPWRVNTPEHSEAIYGKVLPIHIERNQARRTFLEDRVQKDPSCLRYLQAYRCFLLRV